ncbi:type II toxin-antitoxin system RelE/ParE family toxin [Spirochaetota bacterium]
MKYSFHPSARTDLNSSVDYYEERKAGLGLEFSKEVFSAIQRIIQFPDSWPKLSKNTLRCLTNRFPYGIIYHIVEDEVIIIAVMHLNRKPGYWRDRI